jgi:hypothetical protein
MEKIFKNLLMMETLTHVHMKKANEEDIELLMNKKPFLTTRQLSRLFGYKSTDALRKQRSKGNKPIFPFIKIGNRVFYDLSVILELAQRSLIKTE